MTENWYEAVQATTRLTQGDLIFRCPLLEWKSQPIQPDISSEIEILRPMAQATRADVVVMTQACDLEQEKIRDVVLCSHLSLEEYRRDWEAEMQRQKHNPTPKAWKSHCEDIKNGFIWNLTILNRSGDAELSMDHRIVDFHDIFTVPREFLESLLQQRKGRTLRLLPPYREHLSQAFARYFMRVGLPVPVTAAW